VWRCFCDYLTPADNIDPMVTRSIEEEYGNKVELFNDCQHHLRFDTGGIEPEIGISFYHLGKQLHSYSISSLVRDTDKKRHSNGGSGGSQCIKLSATG